jgi:hypothetical protein
MESQPMAVTVSLASLGETLRSDSAHSLGLKRNHASNSGHGSSMAPVGRETSPGRSGAQGASANKRAADSRALVLLPTIRELMAAGFASERGLANELNRRGITGARAGRWHRSSVRRMLTRLRQLTSKHGGTDNNLAWKRVADLRAEALRPTIYNLRKAGFVSISAIARELNKRGIPTPRGGKWHMTIVTRLLERLDRLDRVSRSQRRR